MRQWADWLESVFPLSVRKQGELLESLGTVTIVSADTTEIRADVRDNGRVYKVSMTAKPDGFMGSCQCTTQDSPHTPCAHLWAMLLTLKKRTASKEDHASSSDIASLMFPPEDPELQSPDPDYALQYSLIVHGGVELGIGKCKILKSGALGKLTSVKFDIFRNPELFPEDKFLLSQIHGAYLRCSSGTSYFNSIYSRAAFTPFPLDGHAIQLLLPALAASRRCFLTYMGELQAAPILPGTEASIVWSLDGEDSPRKKP